MKLALTNGSFDDWWVIERAEHNGSARLERTDYGFRFMLAARIGDADVEGNSDEMLSIAAAIETRLATSFKRCAVRFEGDNVFFWSPRNTTTDGPASTLAEADELATLIRAKVLRG